MYKDVPYDKETAKCCDCGKQITEDEYKYDPIACANCSVTEYHPLKVYDKDGYEIK